MSYLDFSHNAPWNSTFHQGTPEQNGGKFHNNSREIFSHWHNVKGGQRNGPAAIFMVKSPSPRHAGVLSVAPFCVQWSMLPAFQIHIEEPLKDITYWKYSLNVTSSRPLWNVDSGFWSNRTSSTLYVLLLYLVSTVTPRSFLFTSSTAVCGFLW